MKKILIILLVLILLAVAVVAWLAVGPSVKKPSNKYLYIPTGSTLNGVRDSLLKNRVLKNTMMFNELAKQMKYNTPRPGRYEIKDGMSVMNLVRMLRNGSQSPVDLVITKLRTKEDLARHIGRRFEPDSTHIIDFLNNADSLRKYQVDTTTAMFLVLPDTYSLFWNSSPGQIFDKLFQASQKFWNDQRRQQATAHGLTPLQTYILASIIEEETNAKTDKPNIASVYLNRMRINMPLQADPTLKFGMRDFGLKRIYSKHTEINSPYNTYTNRGLPPGPICTPSKATIDAVLTSPQTEYLYFVAKSDLSGTHEFTTNYDDHLKFARLYQQKLNQLDSARKAKQSAP